uniref:HECT domain-containing protein n=1 Tax=Scophthalmus maximus TaxID=52904 RepID=A0A8D3DZU0_SCOMX
TMKYCFFSPFSFAQWDIPEEAVSDASEELSLMGSLRFLKTLEERDELVTAVLGFYTEGRVHAPLHHCLFIVHAPSASKIIISIILLFNFFTLVCCQYYLCHKFTDFLLWFANGASPLSLGDVLIFSTGLDKIPAMGFPTQPELEFLHPEDGPAMFPMANTCGPVLRLPVQPTFPKFESAMDMGIGGAIQFGIQ